MIRTDLGQHDGDGLRVFILEIVRQHGFVHIAELVPHGAAGGPADLIHDLRRALARQGLLQQPLGAFITADQVARGSHVINEVEAQTLHNLGPHGAQL